MLRCIKYIGQNGKCRSTLLFPLGVQMFGRKQLNKQECATNIFIPSGAQQWERVKGCKDDKSERDRDM